jgi:hypothetical protein
VSDVIGDLRKDLEARLAEVQRRLANVEPLIRERDELQAVLTRAPFAAPVRPATRTPARPATRTSVRPATRGTSERKAGTRAPRGANREAILKLVGQRPGVSAAEISDVTKISRAVTYNTLAKLVEQGRIEKTPLPGGQTGYKPPAQAA